MFESFDELLLDAEEKMEKSVTVLRGEFRGMRSGRASPGLVEHIRVDYYGSPTPIKQLANIGAPEPNQIVIKPFDPSSIKAVEKAIQASDLGIQPSSDGKVVRLIIPPLSEERRKQLVSRAQKLAEEARVAIRNVRRDANKHADQLEKDGKVTEDELKQAKEDIQDATKRYEGGVDQLLKAKTDELMAV